MNIAKSITDLIGSSPLVRINRMNRSGAEVVAKVESFNPGGSIKDGVARAMIEQAESDVYYSNYL